MTELGEATRTAYVLDVRLDDGERLAVEAGPDRASAEAELDALEAALRTGAHVRLGPTALARASEIRSVQLRESSQSRGSRGDYSDGRNEMATTHQQQHQQQQHDSPGFIDQYVGYGRRPWAETKPFWMTSEFLAFLGTIAAIAIALGTNNKLEGFGGWLLIAIVSAAYIVSRGIAKAGARDPNPRHGGHDRGF